MLSYCLKCQKKHEEGKNLKVVLTKSRKSEKQCFYKIV